MGKLYNPDVLADLGSYSIGVYHPFDVREIVSSFNDLLDVNTFEGTVYEGMRVLVMDEHNVYELISLNDSLGKYAIGLQFSTDRSQNKKLWKRLTIENITEWSALKRAMENLVNGALIYLANDIAELDASNQPTETTHKAGLYFCQNAGGTGTLTMVGGEVTSEQFNELSALVGSTSVSSQIESAVTAAITESITGILNAEY
jgi:hypothetical protein